MNFFLAGFLFFLAILLFITPLQGQKPYEITSLAGDINSNVQRLGNLYIVHSQWTILLFLETQPLMKGLTLIKSHIRRFQMVCNFFRNQEIFKKSNSSEFDRLPCANNIPKLKIRELQLNKTHDVISKLMLPHTERKKRALFGIVGDAAKFLFGTLTESDQKHYDDAFTLMQDSNNNLTRKVNEQITVMRSAFRIIQKNEENISHIVHTTLTGLQKINKELQLQHVINCLNEMLELILLDMQELEHDQIQIMSIIQTSILGKVHPLFLSPKTLIDEIELISQILPKDLHIPFNKDILLTYKSSQVSFLTHDSKIIGMIKLPLCSTLNFNLYRIVPIPYTEKNKNYLIRVQFSYVAIDKTRDNYVAFSDLDIGKCTNIDNNVLCSSKFIYKSARETCETEIILRDSAEFCSHISTQVSNDIWVEIDEFTFIFILKDGKKASILCGKELYQEILKGRGIIKFIDECQLSSKFLTLHTGTRNNSKILMSLEQFNKNFKSLSNVSNLHNEIKSDIVLSNNNKLRTYFEKLKFSEIEERHDVFKNHNIHHYISIYILLTGIVVIVIVYTNKNRIVKLIKKRDNSLSKDGNVSEIVTPSVTI